MSTLFILISRRRKELKNKSFKLQVIVAGQNSALVSSVMTDIQEKDISFKDIDSTTDYLLLSNESNAAKGQIADLLKTHKSAPVLCVVAFVVDIRDPSSNQLVNEFNGIVREPLIQKGWPVSAVVTANEGDIPSRNDYADLFDAFEMQIPRGIDIVQQISFTKPLGRAPLTSAIAAAAHRAENQIMFPDGML